MKRTLSIQLKALLLLIVFGLNTVVGFACSMGMEIGFKKTHQHEEMSAAHHHDENNDTHKHGCCNDAVTKFLQIDKSVPQSLTAAVSPIFFTAFTASFYTIAIAADFKVIPANTYALQRYHPPGAEIRINIQSFQI